MRFFRRVEWTVRTCGFVLARAARGYNLQAFLPPLLTLTAYPLLLLAGLKVPLAFVIAYVLGHALRTWLQTEGKATRLRALGMPAWLFPVVQLVIIAIVLWLESPAAALRIMYFYFVLRMFALLLDLSFGEAAMVRQLWPQAEWRAHDAVLTRVLFLRDFAMILLVETVIFTGSAPLMLALLAFWPLLNSFIDSVTTSSVVLVRHFSTDR